MFGLSHSHTLIIFFVFVIGSASIALFLDRYGSVKGFFKYIYNKYIKVEKRKFNYPPNGILAKKGLPIRPFVHVRKNPVGFKDGQIVWDEPEGNLIVTIDDWGEFKVKKNDKQKG